MALMFPFVQLTEEAVMASFANANLHRTAAVATMEINVAAFRDRSATTRKSGGEGGNATCGDELKKSSELRSSTKAQFNEHHTRVCGAPLDFFC
jgi:hypothetical protein